MFVESEHCRGYSLQRWKVRFLCPTSACMCVQGSSQKIDILVCWLRIGTHFQLLSVIFRIGFPPDIHVLCRIQILNDIVCEHNMKYWLTWNFCAVHDEGLDV